MHDLEWLMADVSRWNPRRRRRVARDFARERQPMPPAEHRATLRILFRIAGNR